MGRLQVGEVDGVVDVVGRVDVAELDLARQHEAVALHPGMVLSRPRARRADPKGDPGAARVATRPSAGRPPAAGGSVVFTGCGTSSTPPRPAARRCRRSRRCWRRRRPTCSSSSATRAGRRWRSRPCSFSARAGSSRGRRRARRGSRRRGARRHARGGGVVLPHGEHGRGRSALAGAARRGRPGPAVERAEQPFPLRPRPHRRRRRGPRRPDRARGHAWPGRACTSPPRRTTSSRSSTATWPRSTRACASSSSRVRAAQPGGLRTSSARSASSAPRPPRPDRAPGRGHRPLPAPHRRPGRWIDPDKIAGTSRAGTRPQVLLLGGGPPPSARMGGRRSVDDHQREHGVLADRRIARESNSSTALSWASTSPATCPITSAATWMYQIVCGAITLIRGLDVGGPEEVPAEAERIRT